MNRTAVIGITVGHAVGTAGAMVRRRLVGIQKATLVTHIRGTYHSGQGRPVEPADIVMSAAHCEIGYAIPMNRP